MDLYIKILKYAVLECLLLREDMDFITTVVCDKYEGDIYVYAMEVQHGMVSPTLTQEGLETLINVVINSSNEEELRHVVGSNEVFNMCARKANELFIKSLERQVG